MRSLALLVLGTILLCSGTQASAVQLDANGCAQMAIWGRDVIWARDVGASREKVRAFLQAEKDDSPIFRVLLPIFDQLWETKADRLDVMNNLYRGCLERGGKFSTDA